VNTATLSRPAEVTHMSAIRPLPVINLAGISGLAAIIAIHTAELSGKIDETAYLGFGYVLLIAASTAAIVLLSHRDRRGWIVAGATALATILGFVLTRTTGLPGAHGDVGNWGETIAVWSLLAEGLVVALAAVGLGRSRLAA
jgi:peptidoglycan/LPS O-acetylase OafA/YrhL